MPLNSPWNAIGSHVRVAVVDAVDADRVVPDQAVGLGHDRLADALDVLDPVEPRRELLDRRAVGPRPRGRWRTGGRSRTRSPSGWRSVRQLELVRRSSRRAPGGRGRAGRRVSSRKMSGTKQIVLMPSFHVAPAGWSGSSPGPGRSTRMRRSRIARRPVGAVGLGELRRRCRASRSLSPRYAARASGCVPGCDEPQAAELIAEQGGRIVEDRLEDRLEVELAAHLRGDPSERLGAGHVALHPAGPDRPQVGGQEPVEVGPQDAPLPAARLRPLDADRNELPARAPCAHGGRAHAREDGRLRDRQPARRRGVDRTRRPRSVPSLHESSGTMGTARRLLAHRRPGPSLAPLHGRCGAPERRWPRSTPAP